MNIYLPLYQFTRSGAAIYLASVEEVDIQVLEPADEQVALRLRILETLYGQSGGPLRRCQFSRPAGMLAQLKFPDPLWGRVALQPDATLLLVTAAQDETPADPRYVDQVDGLEDPRLGAVRAVLAQEQQEETGKLRRDRYVSWLMGSEPMAKLFAAEALGREPDLAAGDPEGFVAHAYTAALQAEQDSYLRMTIAQMMFEQFYPHAEKDSKVIVLNAIINLAAGDDPALEDFALDRLANLSPKELAAKGVHKSIRAADKLHARLAAEPSKQVRERMLKLITILRGAP